MISRILRVSNQATRKLSTRQLSNNSFQNQKSGPDGFMIICGTICSLVGAVGLISWVDRYHTQYVSDKKEKELDEFVSSLKPITQSKLTTIYNSSVEQKQVSYVNALKKDLYQDFNVERMAVTTAQSGKKKFVYNPFDYKQDSIRFLIPQDKICPILKDFVTDYKNQPTVKNMNLDVIYAEDSNYYEDIVCELQFCIK